MKASHSLIAKAPRSNTDLKAVSVLDLVTLLGNVLRGADDTECGFEDAEQSLNELVAHLNRYVQIPRPALESALWSCNLLNEAGKFWDVKDRSFDQYLKHVMRGEAFDLDYNLMEGSAK